MFVRFIFFCIVGLRLFSAFHLVFIWFVYFLFYFGGFLPKFCLAGHFLFVAPFSNGSNALFLVLFLWLYSTICRARLDLVFFKNRLTFPPTALHSSLLPTHVWRFPLRWTASSCLIWFKHRVPRSKLLHKELLDQPLSHPNFKVLWIGRREHESEVRPWKSQSIKRDPPRSGLPCSPVFTPCTLSR